MWVAIALLWAADVLAQSNDVPQYDQPIDPTMYMIRPGDKLQITFVRSKLAPDTLYVNGEGKVVDQTLGVFDLSHTNLDRAREILGDALIKLYNVPDIVISVTDPRSVAITVSGAVRNPGLYYGYTSQRVSELVARAGGVLPDGSRRLIQFRGGVKPLTVDLDKAAFAGDLESDPLLYSGFAVFVPNKSDRVVQIVGEVNTPREVELLPTDDLSLLLVLAGGARTGADTSAISIINRVTTGHAGELEGGDIVVVPPRPTTSEEDKLAIFGAVAKPGFYTFSSGITLKSLIASAGGILQDANSGLTTIFRKPRVDATGRVTNMRFPISHLMDTPDGWAQVELHVQDSVYVPVLVGYVQISGAVYNPGFYPFVAGKDVKSYVLGAGGFLPTADKDQILLFNPVSKVSSVVSPGVVVRDGSQMTIQVREELR